MAQNYKSMLEIGRQGLLPVARGLIYVGFFNPGDEQISIPDNRLIPESCILVIRPEFEIRSVRAQVVNTES